MLIVLGMEVVLVLGTGFLLLVSSSIAGAFARSLLQHGAGLENDSALLDVAAQTGSSSVFIWGILRFMSWFFQKRKTRLIHELGMLCVAKDSVLTVMGSIVAQASLVACIMWLERSAFFARTSPTMFSWENVAASIGDRKRSATESLLFAPIKEELFFRGAIFLVVWNRLRSIRKSTLATNLLFAAVHFANARKLGIDYSASYLLYQVGFAWLVGSFLSLRFAVSTSLLECILLHIVNNCFAMGVSKRFDFDVRDPITAISGTKKAWTTGAEHRSACLGANCMCGGAV